jgi:hypothetical protein
MSGELIVKNNDSKKNLLSFLITAAVVLAVMLPMARVMKDLLEKGTMTQIGFAILIPVLIVVLQPEMKKLISGGKKPSSAVIPWSIRNRVLLLGDVEIPQKSIKMVHCWQKNGAWTVNIETTGKNRLLKSADGADAEDSIQSLYDLVDALGYRSQWKEV